DTVMRALYHRFHKKLGRGWTDGEFRAVCEEAAGGPLTEIFAYASTTKDVDYAKYFAYAGLEFEKPEILPEAFLGAVVEDGKDGRPVVGATEPGSPARAAGLNAGDIIASWNGEAKNSASLEASLKSHKPGDRIKLEIERNGSTRMCEINLANRLKKTWMLRPVADPDPLARVIQDGWLGR
ncbi:MAG: PDZ domain-containing protein, partial [Candidatus Aminicenantes bacterium]|nr:PDZ domain-containing protein [Candidatus Aminicenantes bacterium]